MTKVLCSYVNTRKIVDFLRVINLPRFICDPTRTLHCISGMKLGGGRVQEFKSKRGKPTEGLWRKSAAHRDPFSHWSVAHSQSKVSCTQFISDSLRVLSPFPTLSFQCPFSYFPYLSLSPYFI